MTPGIRTMGYFALRPRFCMASPTWNSRPSLLNFQTSGILFRKRINSTSKRDISISGSCGRLMSYWFARLVTWICRSCRSLGSTKANPRSTPTAQTAFQHKLRTQSFLAHEWSQREKENFLSQKRAVYMVKAVMRTSTVAAHPICCFLQRDNFRLELLFRLVRLWLRVFRWTRSIWCHIVLSRRARAFGSSKENHK